MNLLSAMRDANDLLRQEGADAVRALIDGAKTSNGRGQDLRFKLVRFEDLKPGTEPPFLVRGVVPRVGLTVIWGAAKTFKTFWALDVAMHIALGWQYRGRRVQKGPVVYCAFEGAEGVKRRVEAFRRHHRLAEKPLFNLIGGRADLIREHATLIADIRAQHVRPVLVVLDTLNRSLNGSESKDEDMSNYVRAADAIVEAFDCAVLIVHHSGVDAGRPRGHTSLTGAVDAQLAVKRDGVEVTVTVQFLKDGAGEDEAITSRLQSVRIGGTDQDGIPCTSCVLLPSEPRPDGTEKPPKPPKMTPAQRIALRALREVVAKVGIVPTVSDHIPEGVRVVTVDEWREHAVRIGISRGQKRAQQLAFQRASEELIGGMHVGIWEEQAWPISGEVNDRHVSSPKG
jgi:hypothetical protein